MRTASRLLVGTVLAIFVSCAALAADPAPPPNYQGLWWNSPAESESGWGINLAHQGDVIFATWFTYDAAGDGWWLAMTASRTAEGTYGGTLIETAGPAFSAMPFDPSKVIRYGMGTGTLAFRDPDNGTFSYAVGGVQQSKPITRLAFGTLPACTYAAQPDFVNATNYQDLWWAAGGTESGWGINLAHQGDSLFATWFTYDRDGTPLWLAATAPRVATNVYSGPLIRTTGPAFGAVPFDPARVTRTAAGTATFSFSNGNAGTFAYTLDGVTRSKAIARFLFVPPAGTRCGEAAAATLKGKVHDGSLAGARVCADANGNGRCDANELQALSDATGAYELMAPASYGGPLVAEAIAGQTREAGTAGTVVDRSYRMASPSREYGSNITPFTTLVRLTQESNLRLAEEFVRNELGLPPGMRIGPDAAPAAGSLAQSVAKSVVAALKDTAATLDFSSADALAKVVASFPPALTQLPQLRITTKDSAPILSKETYVDATFTLTNPAATPSAYDLNGKIRGRGNFTWLQDKKPYKVQFANDASYARVPDFLGMKKNRNWALLADYMDRTLVRNKLAFSLGNSSLFAEGLKWTPSGQHVEVTLNGEYVGVYLFTEDVRLDPARLNIRKMSTSPPANDIEGGYIVEVDEPLDCYKGDDINLQHVTPHEVHICVDTPDEEAITRDQLWYVKQYLDLAESDIFAQRDLTRINPVSFADWYLLSELFRNYDSAFFSSVKMWKDTAAAANPADRVLNLGPIWDFDISAGNIPFEEGWKPEGCWVSRSQRGLPSWFPALFDNPDFVSLTLARWKDKRPAMERLVDSAIAAFTRRLEEPQQRNFTRWPLLGGTRNWADPYTASTYGEHVAFLKRFLGERMAWLDKAYASPAAFAALCK
ncbi:MAG: CotH kinase family protein [Betaproteobacteria bacterium]|nr:CotH kinase family protein [Betaproteobacteria bacterium]